MSSNSCNQTCSAPYKIDLYSSLAMEPDQEIQRRIDAALASMPVDMPLNERISALLQIKNGGNQSELARFVPVSPQAVQQWCAPGGTKPRGKNLDRVAEYLGVTTAHLVYGPRVTGIGPESQTLEGVIRMVLAEGWRVEQLEATRETIASLPGAFRREGKFFVPDLRVQKGDVVRYIEVFAFGYLPQIADEIAEQWPDLLIVVPAGNPHEALRRLRGGELIPDETNLNSPDWHYTDIWRPKHSTTIEIPRLDVRASMGAGLALPEQEEIVERMTVNGAWLRRNVSSTNPANLALITAYGDSMEETFSDGDLLLVDRGICEIKIDAVYVLSLNDELYIKRLQRRPDGSVLMISDNKKYEPFLIQNGEREKVSVLGRVLLAWNSKKL